MPLWIRLALALVFAAGLCACGGDSPTDVSAGFGTSPTGSGISGVTAFTFTAEPNGSSASYSWDFGDGTSGSGNVVTHVYAGSGTFRVTLRVRDSGSEATASASVVVGSLTGHWATQAGSDGVWHELRVTQQGSTVTGEWTVHIEPGSPWYVPGGSNGSTSALRGSISSPRTIALSQDGECQRALTNGVVSEPLTTMGGGQRTYGLAECDPTGSMASYPGWLFHRQ